MEGELLYSEHFSDYAEGAGPPEDWWVEGGERVWIDRGRLRVKANPLDQKGSKHVCTVWNKRIFPGDLEVSFRTCVLDSTIEANNINFFLYYANPEGGQLYNTRDLRQDGAYSHYHDLNGYIFTFLNDREGEAGTGEDGRRSARFRMRRCPGFELLTETFDYHCQRDVVYNVSILKKGENISFSVDDKVYLEAVDPSPWSEGLLGLRTFQTDLWWDELCVRRPGA
jgi:hypothetical protein